jgi:hypothetical protein
MLEWTLNWNKRTVNSLYYSKLGIIWNYLHKLYTNYSKTEIFYELLIILKENYDFKSVFKLKRMFTYSIHMYLLYTHVHHMFVRGMVF